MGVEVDHSAPGPSVRPPYLSLYEVHSFHSAEGEKIFLFISDRKIAGRLVILKYSRQDLGFYWEILIGPMREGLNNRLGDWDCNSLLQKIRFSFY